MTRFTLVFLLAVSPMAHADALGDVRTALGRLTGRDPIRATFEVQRTVKSEGKLDNEKFNGKATVEIEGDANGFRVLFSRPLLDQVSREQLARARNPKQSTPTVSALREVDPIAAADAIDYAPALLRVLDGAKIVEDKNAAWQGKPARQVTFRLADREDDDGPGKIKVLENKLTLWLASDHVPLAGDFHYAVKASFLIIKGEFKTRENWHFARITDRLVRVRAEQQQNSSGLGQKADENTISTVRVHG